MRRRSRVTALAAVLGPYLVLAASASAQFPPDSFTNLRVLPQDIPPRELVAMMAGFTRALGVRCTHCHIGEEGQPLETYDFASDKRPAKRTARTMIEMLGRINGEHLAHLESRADPPVRVECITCHRGAREPRLLQDILLAAYSAGGADSTIVTYRDLRARRYGGFAYDFSEVPLADVAANIGRRPGGLADAERIHALNVEMNPASAFARRSHAATALVLSFAAGVEPGEVRHAELLQAYGPSIITEAFTNQVGYDLLARRLNAAAVAAFRINAERFPDSANVWDSLGEGLAANGDVPGAIAAYERSLRIDLGNTNAAEKLRELRRQGRI